MEKKIQLTIKHLQNTIEQDLTIKICSYHYLTLYYKHQYFHLCKKYYRATLKVMEICLKSVPFIFCIIFIGCNQVQIEIDSLKTMIEHADNNRGSLSKEELNLLELKMDELEKHLESNRGDFTEEQVREFNELQGRYGAFLIKKGLEDLGEKIEGVEDKAKGFIKGLQDTASKEK